MAILSPEVRRNALLVITGLVVAYVRQVVQYGKYSWESIGQFLIMWLLHYLAVGFIAAISYGVIKGTEKIFLEYEDRRKSITFEQALVYVALISLVVATFIFILAHWIPNDTYE